MEKRKQQKGELAEVEGLISGQKDYQDVVRKLIIDVQNVNSVLKMEYVQSVAMIINHRRNYYNE